MPFSTDTETRASPSAAMDSEKPPSQIKICLLSDDHPASLGSEADESRANEISRFSLPSAFTNHNDVILGSHSHCESRSIRTPSKTGTSIGS